MGALLFITGIALALFSAWFFYKTGWTALALFIPLAALPFIAVEYAGVLSLFLIPAAFGTAGGLCFREERGFDFYLIVSTLAFTALFTAEYHALRVFKNIDIIEKGRDELVLMMEQGSGDLEMLFEEYKTPEENRKKLKEDIAASVSILKESRWLQFARDMVPFSVFLYSTAICGISFILLKKLVFRQTGSAVKSLEYFRLNDYFIFALIAGWGCFILLDSTLYPFISIVALNLALAVSMLYTIQALGIIKFFIIARGIPAFVLPLLIVTVIALGPPVIIFMTILLLGVGALDLWADFRKLSPDKERNNKE